MIVRGSAFGAFAVACMALGGLSGPAMAQPQGVEIRKPALQLKPAAWSPKAVSKAQLRPQLKPARLETAAAAEAPGDEAYIPASAVNPMREAAAAPVQLASAHTAAQPSEMASGANAMPVSIANFAGRYLGAGVEVALAPSAQEPPRRMSQVEIAGDANRFTVKWATMKIGSNFKPETVKATQQSLTFVPSATPNAYVAVADEPGQAPPEATAELQGGTMIIMLSNTLPSGQRSVQRYERTLTDSGMNVVFTRTEGGAVIRRVNLTLTKSSPGVVWGGL